MTLLLFLWLQIVEAPKPIERQFRIAYITQLPVSERYVFIRIEGYPDVEGPETFSIVLPGPDAEGLAVGDSITVTIRRRQE